MFPKSICRPIIGTGILALSRRYITSDGFYTTYLELYEYFEKVDRDSKQL